MHSKYLPKNALVIILLALAGMVIVGGILWAQTAPEQEVTVSQSRSTDSENSAGNTPQKDTDGDGLADWQELLRGTDPEDKDTDGDGTEDGAEVEANRDPTEPAPGDELEQSSTQTAGSPRIAATSSTLNETEAAGRRLFARFLSARESGALTAQSGQQFAASARQELRRSIENDESLFKTYSRSDITISNNSSDAALKAYGNQMGRILSRYPYPSSGKTELAFYIEAINGDESKFQEIAPYIERYENIITDALEVSVPREAVEAHIGYVNALSLAKTNAGAMKNAGDNPLKSSIVIKRYIEEKEPQVIEDLQNVERFFDRQNISFSNSDPGALYANIEFSIRNQ